MPNILSLKRLHVILCSYFPMDKCVSVVQLEDE